MEENKIIINSFMSAEINEISAALSEFQGSIEQPKLEKEVKVTMKSGGKYSFKYADLSACCKAAAPALKANGLAVSQVICDGKLVTILSHKSGQWFKSELYLPQQSNDYQAYGSAITYLKRYSYCAILGIVADTDDDANMACGNEAEIKDRKNGSAVQVAFTGEQLKAALTDLDACKTQADIQAVWDKWCKAVPSLCAKGTEFFNAVGKKSFSIQNTAGK